jgi:hypothetical protein
MSNPFGTVLITKDRNWCLHRTVTALMQSELAAHPIVVVDNGSTREDPREALGGLPHEYLRIPHNTGIVGARLIAHQIAATRGWGTYCFLQDDFEHRAVKPWLRDTLDFMREFQIGYCRLTFREAALAETEHWVKGTLRLKSKMHGWTCSHTQIPKRERIGTTDFLISDKHYSDWAHLMSIETSARLFDVGPESLTGPTVTDLLLRGDPAGAWKGSLRTEFDIAVKHWLAYATGLIGATGIVDEHPCWCGIFDHFTGKSTTDYRDLPANVEHLFPSTPLLTA